MGVALTIPEGSSERSRSDLPELVLPPLSGLEVTAYRGWAPATPAGASATFAVVLACVRAPSSNWAPGIEALVLGRATQLTQRAASDDVGPLRAGPLVAEASRIRQTLEADGPSARARGAHLLGFAGDARDAVLCTVLCRSAHGTADPCPAVAASLEATGTWMPPPAPSLLTRAALGAAAHPVASAGVSAVLAVVAVWVILTRRPRGRT